MAGPRSRWPVWLTGAGRRFREDAITLLDADIDGLDGHIAPGTVREVLPKLAEIRSVLDTSRSDQQAM